MSCRTTYTNTQLNGLLIPPTYRTLTSEQQWTALLLDQQLQTEFIGFFFRLRKNVEQMENNKSACPLRATWSRLSLSGREQRTFYYFLLSCNIAGFSYLMNRLIAYKKIR